MNVLEKIFEEIDRLDEPYYKGYICKYDVQDIIRNHFLDARKMVDDWIPVEEGLPEETGYYLVQLSRKLPNEDYSDRVVVLYNGEDKEFMCYASLIIAWQPRPEPYRQGEPKLAKNTQQEMEDFWNDK
ncbi:MAG: hypothetical protein KH449_09695 [Lachnospiraceae bacterium]|nr:hypothetical protein [Lachnospiraceae bacterium]